MNPFHQTWVKAFLPGPVPEEPLAQCEACPMCQEGKSAGPVGLLNAVRCCAHYPLLANFMVGALLEEEAGSSPGRAILERYLAQGTGVFPEAMDLGAFHPDERERLRAHPGLFGRDAGICCPFHDSEHQRCLICTYRNAVCATWFCMHVRAGAGKRFWDRLRDVLLKAERVVAEHCVRALRPGVSVDEATWGTSPSEFYRACVAEARSLEWNQILALGGVELAGAVAQVRAAHGELQDHPLPGTLKVGRISTQDLEGDTCWAWSYSILHAVRMPKPLAQLLVLFGEHPTSADMRTLQATSLALLPPSTLRELYDHGILVEDRS